MTVLVDTGVIYAEHDRDATHHESAGRALEAVFAGTYGQPYLSDYIIDECLTLTHARSTSFEPVATLIKKLTGRDPFPPVYDVLFVSRDGFFDSLDVLQRFADQQLSFTDATIISLVNEHDIDAVVSYDDGFQGVIDRIDPREI
ncbi:MAG: type II toxin-antitoxin system VapC family toxin [Halobacteriota archaeon]